MSENPAAEKRRIVIAGAGIAGLSLALALSVDLKFEVYLFEKERTYENCNRSLILWKQGIRALLELGLGERLGKIGLPLFNLSSSTNTKEQLVSWPSELMPAEDVEARVDGLPPMMGVRQDDLIRTLLLALSGDINATKGDFTLSSKDANNAQKDIYGIEADLTYENWYFEEGYGEKLPQIYMNCELAGFQVSSQSGQVVCKFSNGKEVDCDILIGTHYN